MFYWIAVIVEFLKACIIFINYYSLNLKFKMNRQELTQKLMEQGAAQK